MDEVTQSVGQVFQSIVLKLEVFEAAEHTKRGWQLVDEIFGMFAERANNLLGLS